MTNEERITGLEDAVTHLTNIMEHRTGSYAADVNQAVVDQGAQIHSWARAVQEHRAGT